jgi:hypothetical protein
MPTPKVAYADSVETSPRSSDTTPHGSARLRPASAPRSSSPEPAAEALAARRATAGSTIAEPAGSAPTPPPAPTAFDAIAPLLKDQK